MGLLLPGVSNRLSVITRCLIIKIVLCIIFHSYSDADVDADSADFVIVRPDSDYYQDADISDSDSSDDAEITGR